MTTADLYDWSDQVMYNYGASLQQSREMGDVDLSILALDETKLAAAVGLELATEIQARTIRQREQQRRGR